MDNKIKREIGQRIKDKRLELGISQEELARRLGYKSNNSRSTINKIESGINDVAQSKLPLYAHALNTTVAYILGLDNPSAEVKQHDSFIEYLKSLGYEYEEIEKSVKIPKHKIPAEFQAEISGECAIGSQFYFKIYNKATNISITLDEGEFEKLKAKNKEFLEGLILLYHQKQNHAEKTYRIKKAARNGSFEEKTITDKELDEIKNLPDVDDLK